MAELYFKYQTKVYLFDTKQLKLFRLRSHNRIEIKNPETLGKIRLGSKEIYHDHAFRLAFECEKLMPLRPSMTLSGNPTGS